MKLIALALLAAVVIPTPENTRQLVTRCGGAHLIGTTVQGRFGRGEFLDIVERERLKCHIQQRNGLWPGYDCDEGACEMVRQISQQIPPKGK